MKKYLPLTLVLLTQSLLLAETKTWIGGDGLWFDPAMWDPAGVPAAADDILIENGTCTYVPGGDCHIHGTLTLGPGGTWVQTDNNSWFQLAGTLNICGGIFNLGTSDKINTGSNFLITMSSGALRQGKTFKTDLTHSPNVSITGGLLDITQGEFQYNRDYTINYNLTTTLIAAQNSTFESRIFSLQSGHITITASSYNGFYGKNETTYLNFPKDSTAVLTLANWTPSNVYSAMFAGDTPYIRYNGDPVSEAVFATLFSVTPATDVNGVDISLVRLSDGAASFQNENCEVDAFTEDSLTLSTTVDDPGSPVADVFLCYGASNGGIDWDGWGHRIPLGAAESNKAYEYTLEVAPESVTYYRFAATNSSGISFAQPTPAFIMTAAPSVTIATNEASEASVDPISITFSRPTTCTVPNLTIPFTLGGTALLNTHYTLSTPSPITIPSGSTTATLNLYPKPAWNDDEDHTMTLTLDEAPYYLPPVDQTIQCTFLNKEFPAAPTNTFLGAVSSDGGNAANWSLGHLPTASEIVYVSPTYAAQNLVWPKSLTEVAGWVQPLPFHNPFYYVTINTTPEAPLVIHGDCILEAGVWLHSGASAIPENSLSVHVEGDLVVGASAILSAGLDTVNLAYGYSAGYLNAGPGYAPATGASFAGEGPINATTYGSILNPLSYGSSGTGDGAQYAGAGIVKLTVDGTLTHDGRITAIGFGYNWEGFSASSGGSINITCAKLLGTGEMNANGGLSTTGGSGSGGRIRVKLTDPIATFDDFTGALKAEGRNSSPSSAAGTIALQTAADAPDSALVIVSNPEFSYNQPVIEPGEIEGSLITNSVVNVRCTHLPATLPEDTTLRRTRWELRDHANLRLTDDTLIESLSVPSETVRIFLNGYTLQTKSFTLSGTAFKTGSYTSLDLPAILFDEGAIEVLPESTLILCR